MTQAELAQLGLLAVARAGPPLLSSDHARADLVSPWDLAVCD